MSAHPLRDGGRGPFWADILLEVLGRAVEQLIATAGAKNFSGKTIIDVTHPIANAAAGGWGSPIYHRTELIAGRKFLKNIIRCACSKSIQQRGERADSESEISSGRPATFFLQQRSRREKKSKKIILKFGWESCDYGMIVAARAIERLCALWCVPRFLNNQWAHAFKLLEKIARLIRQVSPGKKLEKFFAPRKKSRKCEIFVEEKIFSFSLIHSFNAFVNF